MPSRTPIWAIDLRESPQGFDGCPGLLRMTPVPDGRVPIGGMLWVKIHKRGCCSVQQPQIVEKHAFGGFFNEICTVCLGAYGSPGGKR